MPKQEIEKRSTTAVEQVPDFLKTEKPRGTEEAEREDLMLPRVALCQDTTPQRKKANASYLEGLEEGMLFNTLTGEIYGTELEFIPLFFFKQRILFEDIDEGGGILCQSRNGVDGGQLHPEGCATCEKSQFQGGDPPECTKLSNWLALAVRPSGLEPVVLSFKSTSTKVSKQLLSLVRMSGLDAFAKRYRVLSADETKNNNTYKQYVLKPLGFVTQEQFEVAKKQYELFHGATIAVDTSGMEADTEFNEEI